MLYITLVTTTEASDEMQHIKIRKRAKEINLLKPSGNFTYHQV
jgi:hypothetical protein